MYGIPTLREGLGRQLPGPLLGNCGQRGLSTSLVVAAATAADCLYNTVYEQAQVGHSTGSTCFSVSGESSDKKGGPQPLLQPLLLLLLLHTHTNAWWAGAGVGLVVMPNPSARLYRVLPNC